MEAQEELKGAPPESTPAAEESGDEGNDPLDPIPNTYSKIMEAKIASLKIQAKALSESGSPKRAVTRLSRAIVLKPDDPELFRLRGEAAVMAGEYHTAIINFKRVIALRKNENESMSKRMSAVYYQYGVELAAKERHEEAVDSFWNSEKHDAKNKEAVARRMECLIAMQKYSECMEVIEKEVKKDASNPDLYVVRAQLNMLFGQTTQGYLDVCKALEMSDSHSEALEMKQDMEKKAKECKNQAIQKSLIGNREGALRKLNDAIQLDPGVAEYLILRGSVYRRMGDFNAAVDDLLSAMDKCEHRQDSPIYINASKQLLLTYNDFAMVCFKQRKFDSAVTLLNKAIKQEKREKGLYLNRGDCFYRLGNLQFALSDYQQALELEPTDWQVYCRVAVVYCEIGVELFSRGQHLRAEELFSAAIQHNPKVSRFYICRARTRYELKNITGSKEDILFSILLDPNSDACVPLLARVFAGKSKEEVLITHEAARTQLKLQSIIKHTADVINLKAGHGKSLREVSAEDAKLEKSPLKSAIGLGGFELKFEAESSENRKSMKGKATALNKPASTASSAKLEAGSAKSGSIKSGSVKSGSDAGKWMRRSDASITKPLSQPMTSHTVLMGSSEEGGQAQLSPREWSVLSYPLPELPTSSHGLLTSLQDAFKESHFHKSIYYSKKTCDSELEGVLKSRLRDYVRPPPPRVQNFHDVVIGGRSILTASSLIKSVK